VFLVRLAAGVSALAALWVLSGCGNIAPPGSNPVGPVGNESLKSDESLAFSRSGLLPRLPNIYLLDDENGLRTVGKPGKNDVKPLWSPDGSQLIYQKAYGWESDYFLLDVASWHTRQLTADGFYKYLPRWSPDGVRLAYLSANEPGDPSHKSDFLNVVEISNGESRSFPFERVLDYRWRPGGQALLAVSRSGDTTSLQEITLSGIKTRRDIDVGYLDGSIAVSLSPDASRVAYALPDSDPDALADSLYIAALDSAGGSKVGGYAIDSSMAWSPDGSSLAFVSFGDEYRYALFVVNADESGYKELLVLDTADESGEILPGAPAWSPDGQKIAISSFSSLAGSAIFILSADGSEIRQVTQPGGLIYGIVWKPE